MPFYFKIKKTKFICKFLTIEIFGDSDLRKKTISVERITDVNGAAAETQKSFGHLMLCNNELKIVISISN